MARLILVRHGQTRSNVHGLLDTAAPGPGLTPLGRDQAAAVVGVLAAEPIERVVASPLLRAVETATPLAEARGLPLGQDEGLGEILAGDLELLADRESHLTYLHTVFGWATGDVDRTMPGGRETGTDFLARYDRAVEAALDGVDTAVCVSHGAAIRTWAGARAENVDAEFGSSHGLPNTGVIVLDRTGAGPWRVDTWTDHRFPAPDDDPTGAPVA